MQHRYLATCVFLLGMAPLSMGCPSQTERGRGVQETAEPSMAAPPGRDATWAFQHPGSGISLSLPDDAWTLSDLSQGPVTILSFAREEQGTPGCVAMSLPGVAVPDGLLSRENQIQMVAGDYQRTSYGEASLAGLAGEVLEYMVGEIAFVEYGVRDGDRFVVLQLRATPPQWQDAETAAQLDHIRASFHLGSPIPTAADWDLSTADEVRARRREAVRADESDAASLEIVHHDISLTVEPATGRLESSDTLVIESKIDGLAEISLMTTLVTIDTVTSSVAMDWHVEPGIPGEDANPIDHLIIELAQPLGEGERLQLTVGAHCDDFLQVVESQLVAEVSVLGQVREESSYSSHVLYYPIDETNAASADITLRVPTGYVAVGGGTLVERAEVGDQTIYRFAWERRQPNLLPLGFAVARYLSESATTDGGLRITVYGLGDRSRVTERVSLALEAADLFERTMGPLPWSDVRIAQVSPVEREMGVSLPGLILISDGFWGELQQPTGGDGAALLSENLDLLVVVDELAHQWNAYRVPFPNELAEGISTFANALFFEHRLGREAYAAIIRYLAQVYLSMAGVGREVAIADPDIYDTPSYRVVAFCKVPLILDMLRTRLGDDLFFRAWREAFAEADRGQADYDTLQQVFEQVSGQNLRRFFDQWFFRAGHPQIQLDFSQDGTALLVTLRQVQPGEPYDLQTDILVRGASDEEVVRHPVVSSQSATTVEIECPFDATEVTFDPDNRVLADVVD